MGPLTTALEAAASIPSAPLPSREAGELCFISQADEEVGKARAGWVPVPRNLEGMG